MRERGQAMAKGVLFDLDGTLLGLDILPFMTRYFGLLEEYLGARLDDDLEIMGRIVKGVNAMAGERDDGSTNEAAFREAAFPDLSPALMARLDKVFAAFYAEAFPTLKGAVKRLTKAAPVVRAVREQGFLAVLATNPLFPRAATVERMAWAGLREQDFALVTTYEEAPYSKPDPRYYAWILKETGIDAGSWMVGNDALEDGCAKAVGLRFYLVENDYTLRSGESPYTPDAQGPLTSFPPLLSGK